MDKKTLSKIQGRNLRIARRKRGLTAHDLGEIARPILAAEGRTLSDATIYAYEKGRISMGAEVRSAFSQILGERFHEVPTEVKKFEPMNEGEVSCITIEVRVGRKKLSFKWDIKYDSAKDRLVISPMSDNRPDNVRFEFMRGQEVAPERSRKDQTAFVRGFKGRVESNSQEDDYPMALVIHCPVTAGEIAAFFMPPHMG